MNFFRRRSEQKKKRKHIEHAIFQVKYARRMREDKIDPATRDQLRAFQTDLKGHIKAKTLDQGVSLSDKALKLAKKIHPAPRGAYGVRENVEVFVVVITVALGFRTYFFQPYQIPTGSMQPTLYGITSQADYEPNWMDKVPFRYGKFLVTGSRYREIKAKASGIMPEPDRRRMQDTFYLMQIGGKRHKIHKDMLYVSTNDERMQSTSTLHPWVPRPGTVVKKGDVIAKGLQKQGDHILVNRFITNFKRPDRGDIVVFHTAGLPKPVRQNSAYIKRLTGLPGEKISLQNGKLVADGKVIDSPAVFQRQYEDPTYPGYINPTFGNYVGNHSSPILALPSQSVELGKEEYLMMGDNTHNSLDGRYFGAVPGDNIMGIGFFVPWPFINRGIYNDRAGPVQ